MLRVSEQNNAVCPYCDEQLDMLDVEQFLDDFGPTRNNQISVVQDCPSCENRVEVTITFTIIANVRAI